MSRKDYVSLAEALRRAHEGVRNPKLDYMWTSCVNEIADVLAADNPRFDRQRFYSACEGRK